MFKCFITVVLLLGISDGLYAQQQSTYCNPININYRFVLGGPSGREAADPTLISFKGDYYLFASKSGGYWFSSNLSDWQYVPSKTLPVEEYAPTAVIIDDTVYYTASFMKDGKIYKNANPKKDDWQPCNVSLPIAIPDPALFLDSGKRLFVYFGTSPSAPISGVELHHKTFEVLGKPTALFSGKPAIHGWEVAGDNNNNHAAPSWMEGAWMTKIGDTYYLQYAAPGTIYNTYADGYYTSKNPLGPFTYAATNPFSFKPGGFINGAGHGSVFNDAWKNYWHITTGVISVVNRFERRLCLFPVGLDTDQVLYTNTYAGDYPHWLPAEKFTRPEDYFTGWMLLSFQKKATASSSLNKFPVSQAFDENIKTHWAAKTNKKGEWLQIDLGKKSSVRAVQINFSEHAASIVGRDSADYHQYVLMTSNNNKKWKTFIDKRSNHTSVPHDYIELKKPVKARYVKLINHYVPDSNFAISGLRVFGKTAMKKPQLINAFKVERSKEDPRRALISWLPSKRCTGYIIRFGTHPDKLYHSYMVYAETSLQLNSLDAGTNYYFSIDSFNESGITKGTNVIKN